MIVVNEINIVIDLAIVGSTTILASEKEKLIAKNKSALLRKVTLMFILFKINQIKIMEMSANAIELNRNPK